MAIDQARILLRQEDYVKCRIFESALVQGGPKRMETFVFFVIDKKQFKGLDNIMKTHALLPVNLFDISLNIE